MKIICSTCSLHSSVIYVKVNLIQNQNIDLSNTILFLSEKIKHRKLIEYCCYMIGLIAQYSMKIWIISYSSWIDSIFSS